MTPMPGRMFMYTKDVMNITGRSARTARRMIAAIKKEQGKKDKAFITVDDFCSFTGIREEKVKPFLTS